MTDPRSTRQAYSRERLRHSLYTVSGHLSGIRVVSGSTTVLANQSRVKTFTNKEVMHDIVTPGFSQRQANGGLVSNPMDQSRWAYSGSDSGFKASLTNANSKETWEEAANVGAFYFGPPVAAPNTINIENLKRLVSTRALAKVRPSNFQAYVAAAEARKTLRMLINPLAAVGNLLDFISNERKAKRNLRIEQSRDGASRSINGRTFYRNPKQHDGPGREVKSSKRNIVLPFGEAISGTALMINLGLKPMLMDIDEILHRIPNAHQLDRQTYRDDTSQEQKSSETRSYVTGGYTFKATVETTHKVSCRASILAEDRFDILKDFGLDLASLPSAFWEVVPYSFVVDYFINIGDILGALRAQASYNMPVQCVVTTIDTVVTRTWTDSLVGGGWVFERALAGQDTLNVYAKAREAALPAIGLAYRPLNEALTPTRVINMLSLIVQQLVGIQRTGHRTPFY